jgi:hypothetical protein
MDECAAVRFGRFRALVDYLTINMMKPRYWPILEPRSRLHRRGKMALRNA